MNQKITKTLATICLVVAAVGVYTLMLKNPDDNVFNIPIFLCIMIALALGRIRPKK